MAGTLTHQGGDKWRARFWIDDPIRGRTRRSATIRAKGRRQAEQRLSELVAAAAPATDTRLVADMCAEVIELGVGRKTPGWIENQRSYLRRHLRPALGRLTMAEATPENLERAYRSISASPQTLRHCHWIVNAAFKRELRRKTIEWNPAAHVELPPLDRDEVQPPKLPDVVTLLARAGEIRPDFPLFLRLLIVTGARRGEVAAITWRQVDWIAGELRIDRALHEASGQLLVKGTKTSKSRTVGLDAGTLAMLEQWHSARTGLGLACADDHFVFGLDASTPTRPSRYTRAFNELRLACGVPDAQMKNLRHLAASMLFASGTMSVIEVSKQLGHARTSTTTDIYAHLIDASDSRRRASNALGGMLAPAPNDL